MLGVGGFALDLLAQTPDVHCDGARVCGGAVAPNPVHELLAAEHLAGVAGEEPQQVELASRQRELVPVAVNLATGRLDNEFAEGEPLGRQVQVASPAQHGSDTSDELSR